MNYSNFYKNALLKDVVPFWEKYSLDHDHGGYFSCLDRTGKVYDTDKFIWLQARQAWTFAMLYNTVEKNGQWLDIATLGIEFIVTHGMDAKGNFYFSTTREGRPLVQPYNIFTDCFAAMALAQYGKASRNQVAMDLAVNTYRNILQKREKPKGAYEKSTGHRKLRSFALPMILANVALELEGVLKKEDVEHMLDDIIHEIMYDFLDKDKGIVYEAIGMDGTFHDSFEGRLVNPGHSLEAMWFVIDIAKKGANEALVNKAIECIVSTLEFAWDHEYGGIYYFMDVKGHPPLQLEHKQKLWWVHTEALIALAKAYEISKNKLVYKWFNKVHNYAWSSFLDPEKGEWFGYLNREGEINLSLKGGKWKGCFHVPRAMLQCWKTFERIEGSL